MKKGAGLSSRDRSILKDVITTFLTSGVPVSSRKLSKARSQELSAATIRNVMADLADLGYLSQPHTSAGRVPTSVGYHFFIESLMQEEQLSDKERDSIDSKIDLSNREELTAAASRILSSYSQQIGIVLTSDLASVVLRRIEFVPLSNRKLLCVSVSQTGFVDHKVVQVDREIGREDLVRISNYLTENFAGTTLEEVRSRLLSLMATEQAELDEWMSRSLQLAQQGLAWDSDPHLVVEGTESLLGQPELASVRRVRKLFETFADKARVVGLLNQCLVGEGVRVFIGDESDLTSELDLSLILRDFTVDGRRAGTIGLCGPSRMEYPRLIPLVEYLSDRLSQALSQTM